MKFSAQFTKVLIDPKLYAKVLNQEMREALARGMVAYLNTVLATIPSWSGASRATFLQLARTISLSIPIPINTTQGLNRIALGESCGSGRLVINTLVGTWHFEYKTSLEHLIYNEYHNANSEQSDPKVFKRLLQPGPYGFQDKGIAAFDAIARTTELPNPWNYTKLSVIRTGKHKVI